MPEIGYQSSDIRVQISDAPAFVDKAEEKQTLDHF